MSSFLTRALAISLATATLLIPPYAGAQDDERRRGERPRWMSPEAGWVDKETDMRVERVSRDDKDGTYKVEISMPRVEQTIEEVVVVGVEEEGPSFELPVRYEVINDLDSGRSGIILYLGTEDPFALQINYDKGVPQKAEPKDPGLIRR
jgi:hypothetical protein